MAPNVPNQPINPDDEDDVVPEQHAAFGIQRATQRSQQPAWRDLGLERILDGGPPATSAITGDKSLGAGLGANVGGSEGSGAAAAASVRNMR